VLLYNVLALVYSLLITIMKFMAFPVLSWGIRWSLKSI